MTYRYILEKFLGDKQVSPAYVCVRTVDEGKQLSRAPEHSDHSKNVTLLLLNMEKKSDLTVQFGPFSVLIIQKHLSSSVYYFANSFEIFLRGVNSKGCWKDDSTGPVAHLFSCI